MHRSDVNSPRLTKRWAKQAIRIAPLLVLVSFPFCIVISGCLGGCLSALANGQQQAQTLVTELHQKMTNGDLAGIYDGADQRYKDAVTRQRSDALFSSVSRKLGTPGKCNQQGFTINATTSGTVLRLVCKTTFSKDATGTESFTWIKSGEQFRLLRYDIESEELIER